MEGGRRRGACTDQCPKPPIEPRGAKRTYVRKRKRTEEMPAGTGRVGVVGGHVMLSCQKEDPRTMRKKEKGACLRFEHDCVAAGDGKCRWRVRLRKWRARNHERKRTEVGPQKWSG